MTRLRESSVQWCCSHLVVVVPRQRIHIDNFPPAVSTAPISVKHMFGSPADRQSTISLPRFDTMTKQVLRSFQLVWPVPTVTHVEPRKFRFIQNAGVTTAMTFRSCFTRCWLRARLFAPHPPDDDRRNPLGCSAIGATYISASDKHIPHPPATFPRHSTARDVLGQLSYCACISDTKCFLRCSLFILLFVC
jgi:hypothetical protein